MPKGPQGQRRPADAIGCAVMVGRIATGEIGENLSPAVRQDPLGESWGAEHAQKNFRKRIAWPLPRRLPPGGGVDRWLREILVKNSLFRPLNPR